MMAMNDNFYIYDVTIEVVRPWYAPFLSDLKPVKKKQLDMLKECYAKFYDDTSVIERVTHLDSAFHRDSECMPFVDGGVMSGALRSIGYKNAIVRGVIYLPVDSILIDTRSVSVGTKRTAFNGEYVMPTAVVNAKLQINMTDLTTAQLYVGQRRSKGYGMINAKFKRLT